jgi:hypothetical protein
MRTYFYLQADKLIDKLPIGEKTIWTPAVLGVSNEAFQEYIDRVLDLAIDGKVEALGIHRSEETGHRDAVALARQR